MGSKRFKKGKLQCKYRLMKDRLCTSMPENDGLS